MPRILDLLDKHDIKMSSFMISDAVRRHPEVAAEIVPRGHWPKAKRAVRSRAWARAVRKTTGPKTGVAVADSSAFLEQPRTTSNPAIRGSCLAAPPR